MSCSGAQHERDREHQGDDDLLDGTATDAEAPGDARREIGGKRLRGRPPKTQLEAVLEEKRDADGGDERR